MERHLDRTEATWADREYEVVADRERARFAGWYEFFPRSERDLQGRGGGARARGGDGLRRRVPAADPSDRAHQPQGPEQRARGQGATPEPVGIGGTEGGHTAVHPELGTLDDFDRFVERARGLGLESHSTSPSSASPDHPWVRLHPEWFFHRPDGTIKYAENPPKKYQDVYPVNFHCADPRPLWQRCGASSSSGSGTAVRAFRVDNPHTKP